LSPQGPGSLIRHWKLIAAVVAVALATATGFTLWLLSTLGGGGDPIPYGLHAAPPEEPFSFDRYAELLAARVGDGRVDYAGLVDDRRGLDEQVAALAVVPPETEEAWPAQERLAFWLNAYNVLTLALVADHYPPLPELPTSVIFPYPSIRHIHGAWERYRFKVAGQTLSLNEIEHSIVRAEFDEPRVHFAMVCASVGCPPLRGEPYRGADLDAQLADQTRQFLATRRNLVVDRAAGRVRLSSIFQWFGADFGASAPADGFGQQPPALKAVLAFVASHHPDPEVAAFLQTGQYDVGFLSYDWALNDSSEKR
jgi:hypothetical protein